MTFHVHSITWDTTDYDDDSYDPASPNIPDLPSECEIECDSADDIADALSDKYGFCVEEYDYEDCLEHGDDLTTEGIYE